MIQSLHKTLPSLTQTAVLHARRGYVDLEKLERYLQMFQTSSPSYVFLASMERCIYELAEHGNAELLHFHGRLDRVRAALRGMKHLRLMDFSKEVPNRKNENGVFDFDPAKLVVSCRNCVRVNADGSREQLDGNGLSDWLRTQFHLEMEMCGADYIVAIASYPDSEEGLGRLVAALTEIDKNLECADRKIPETTPEMQNAVSGEKPDGYDEAETPWDLPQIVLPMAEALEQKSCLQPLAACAGSISGEFIYLYPPGIPIAAPGERVTERIVERVLHYQRMGLPVQGMADVAAKSLRVCVPEQGAADR